MAVAVPGCRGGQVQPRAGGVPPIHIEQQIPTAREGGLVESLPGTGQEGLCSLSLAAALGVELGFQEPVDLEGTGKAKCTLRAWAGSEGRGKARSLQARGAPGSGQGQGLWQPSFSRRGCCHLGFPMGFPVRSCWLRAGGGQEVVLQVEVRA